MTPNHDHNPHHRGHMLGSPLFDPNNNMNGNQGGEHPNPNLAQMLNMMQSPAAQGLPPQFNNYRQHQHQSPHQRFPYMNPAAGVGGYSAADLMRFQAHPRGMGGPPPPQQNNFYPSPVSSPEEMRKRAAAAAAAQQGYYGYPPDPMQQHMNQQSQAGMMGHAQNGNPGFYPHQQFGAAHGGGGNEPSMPPLPQAGNNQYGNFMETNRSNSNNNNIVANNNNNNNSSNNNNIVTNNNVNGGMSSKTNTSSNGEDASLEKNKNLDMETSPVPEGGEEAGGARSATTGDDNKPMQTPEKSGSLESIVNSLSSPVPTNPEDREGDVDLTPLGTILNSSPDGRSGRGRGRGRGRGGGGRGRGRGRGRGKKGILSLTKTQPDGTIVPIDAQFEADGTPRKDMPVYYTGSVSLGLEEDQYWLSELQVYLRSNFAEAFGATEKDIAAPMHGRNKPIALGQVGIRCIWCKNEPPSARGQQAVSYPSLVSGIYNSVQQMFRLHFDCCPFIPPEVKKKIETLRASSSSRGGRKQYWIDSAKRLGLVDTPHGIHFGRDPTGPLPPLSGPSAAAAKVKKEKEKDNEAAKAAKASDSPGKGSLLSQEHTDEIKRQKENTYPLVLPEDKSLISEYLYVTLQQMEPCKLMDADRVGCYKGRDMGFPGLACKWCVGQAGCGRYFPASEASLSQTTTSQTILNHVKNCRKVPVEIRENLEIMRRNKLGPDGKKYDKPKHGGRKVFFHRLWCRIQGLEIEEISNVEVKIGRQKGAKNKAPTKKRKKKKRGNDSGGSGNDDEETETEDEDDEAVTTKKKRRGRKRVTSLGKKRSIGHIAAEEEESSADEMSDIEDLPDISHPGCVPLSKPDDAHWLSDLQCFLRSDMVEAFAVTAEDIKAGIYKDVEELQVGIRCKYTGSLPPEERPDGHCYFPHSLSAIQSCVSDLHRRYFSSCTHIPEDVCKTFQSLKGFTGKADGETHQYWVDSARELGLSNYVDSKGVHFFRNPAESTPADELDKERNSKEAASEDESKKKTLIKPNDIATSHALLLMKQVRPCKFKSSDRRGGPGSRSRDRVIGFPGVACVYGSSKNNSGGRYFPMSSKSLGENTFNSIQTYVTSCERCPETVKASLAYVSHRTEIEKSELGGGWKKQFFKTIWDRLHVERAWSSNPVKESNSPEEGSYASDEEEMPGIGKVGEAEDDMVDETLDTGIGEMVKAAAQWLTDRDADNDLSQDKTAKSKAQQRRGLPTGKGLPSRVDKSKGTTQKRQKV